MAADIGEIDWSHGIFSRALYIDRARSAKIIVLIREYKSPGYVGLCKSTDLEAMKRFVCERLEFRLFADAIALEYQARSREAEKKRPTR